MKISKEIQYEILKNYFSFDGKVATLKLVYDTFSELINPNFGDDKIEKLNDKLFSDIKEAVFMLPKGYKLRVKVVIKDFGTYSKDECEKIIRQNIELFVYNALKSNNRKRISGWSLIGVGAVVLLLSYLLSGNSNNLWFDLINISGTLFVWEGVSTAFIEKSLDIKTNKLLAKSIQEISIEKGGSNG